MKILLIEDEHKIATALEKGFKQERMVVEVYYDGESGLAAALADEYDVIVLDRMLPGGKDGADICRELRASGNHTPVLLLTARGQVHEKVEGLDAGADDYLVKPFSFEELLARVRALMRRPHETISPVLELADLRIDPASFRVTRAGKTIEEVTKDARTALMTGPCCNQRSRPFSSSVAT